MAHGPARPQNLAQAQDRDPQLVATLDTQFQQAHTTLNRYATGDTWKLHNQLTAADLKTLSDSINALAEPISQIAAAIAH
ncbi:hypothetical protein AB0M47_23340 [Hamadaea sp. NPDC051192]|uniref:hypothetical protein n=1 Tax=Hamadaea sp. NPDC051192 TaxID=3154940 RepID=UPI003422379B